jgi:hypoxanthine phosphoribosyltransferase
VEFDHAALPPIHGRHVLLLDDILDSGNTLAAIIETIRLETGPLSLKSCVLLRKIKKRDVSIEADYVGFDIEDEFVVGYGLDYQERYRNLPLIGVLKS